MGKVFSICPYCGGGSGLYLEVRDGKIVGVEPSLFHPVTKCALCVEDWSPFEFIHNTYRLTKPLIRRSKKKEDKLKMDPSDFSPVSWDEVFDLISERFLYVKKRHGGNALGFLVLQSAQMRRIF